MSWFPGKTKNLPRVDRDEPWGDLYQQKPHHQTASPNSKPYCQQQDKGEEPTTTLQGVWSDTGDAEVGETKNKPTGASAWS